MTAHIGEPGPWEARLAGGIVRHLLYRGRRGRIDVPDTDRHLPRRRFRSSDGSDLVGIHHPAAEPRGIVVLVHPDKRLGKHWWTRNGAVAWLNANGLDAFAFDLSVYGESRPGNVYLHTQVLAAIEEARRLQPDLPMHVWGVSIGSFAAANAAVATDAIDGLALESPYPTFDAWYAASGWRIARRMNALLVAAFPATARRLRADRNIAATRARRVLVAASDADAITPIALSRAIAAAAPADRVRSVEVPDAPHLGLFAASPAYRAALLETFLPPTTDLAATVTARPRLSLLQESHA